MYSMYIHVHIYMSLYIYIYITVAYACYVWTNNMSGTGNLQHHVQVYMSEFDLGLAGAPVWQSLGRSRSMQRVLERLAKGCKRLS